MWESTALLSQLRQQSRWKVEVFCNEGVIRPHAVYDWTPLRVLFDERKETLDPQAFLDHLFNYIGLENVQSATGDLVGFEPRYGKEIRSKTKVFRKGDVLYGRLRPYLNKVYLADGQVSNGICSGEFYVLMPKTNLVLPHFARAILSSMYVQQFVANLQTGSALPRLQLDDLMKIEIPLPPLAIQTKCEKFIMEATARRQRLAAELAKLPQMTLNALTQALESGDEPHISQYSEEVKVEDTNPLPIISLLA